MNQEVIEEENEVPESSPLADLLSHPFRSLQGLLEFAMAWLFTREWKAVAGFSPVLLLVLTWQV